MTPDLRSTDGDAYLGLLAAPWGRIDGAVHSQRDGMGHELCRRQEFGFYGPLPGRWRLCSSVRHPLTGVAV